jgi:hypothetical protein
MAVSCEKHSFWSKDRRGSSWLTERLLTCQEVTSVTQQHVWYVWRQEGCWHAWIMSFVWTAHLTTLKDNFIIFAAFLSEILVTALIAQFTSCWTQHSRARYARIGKKGASNPDVCHAQNHNPATQCIILFASAILCLSCTTPSYKKKYVDSGYCWLLHHNHSTLASFVLETATDNRACGQRKSTASD